MKNLGLAARIFVTDNQDRLPTTFEQMTNELPANLPVAPEAFEFVQHVRPVTEAEPFKLLFRERTARRLANGKWARVYAFVDGSVQEQLSDTDDFSAWESQHVIKDTPK